MATGRASVPAGGVRAAMAGGNTVGGELREAAPRADGYRHIDTPGLLRRLAAARVNTYLFGIWNSPTDWDDLRLEFLPAAERAGIAVWPYIVPPSEQFEGGRGSRPFGTDYIAWSREIAALSTRHPNVPAWGIDDFHIGDNARTFTPEYVAAMRQAGRSVNPALEFWLCAYFGTATDAAFLDSHRGSIDGVLYPYLNDPYLDTEDPTAVGPRLDDIRAVTEPRGLGVVLLVYCGRFLDAMREPDEEYVRACVHTGLDYAIDGRADGVIAYGLPVDGAPLPATEQRSMYGAGRLALTVSERHPTTEGGAAWAEQRVAVDGAAARHELSFWHRSDCSRAPELRGYHAKEVLLDGEPVWQQDALDAPPRMWINGHTWQGPVDLGDRLRGRESATLTLRLVERRGVSSFGVDVGFDHLEAVGLTIANPGFEERDGWQLGSSHPAMHAAIDIAHPDRPQRIAAAVAEEYAR